MCPPVDDPIDGPICISSQLSPLLPLCCLAAPGFSCCRLDLPPKGAERLTFDSNTVWLGVFISWERQLGLRKGRQLQQAWLEGGESSLVHPGFAG